MKKAYWVILAVILVLIAIAGFVFYNSQKENDSLKNDGLTKEDTAGTGNIPTKKDEGEKIPGGGMNRAPMAPQVTCSVEAEVLSAEKTTTELNELAISAGRENSEYYLIKLKISNITTADGNGFDSCDADYIKRVEEEGAILSLANFEANPVTEGQKITAKIQANGDEYYSGYFLGDIKNQ